MAPVHIVSGPSGTSTSPPPLPQSSPRSPPSDRIATAEVDRRSMDRRAYGRQHGAESAPSSPAHPAAGGRAALFGTVRRAPKAAAASARMAQVMMRTGPDYDDDDEDDESDLIPSIVGGWIGGGGGGGGRRRGGSSPRMSAAASYGGARGVSMETAAMTATATAARNSSSLFRSADSGGLGSIEQMDYQRRGVSPAYARQGSGGSSGSGSSSPSSQADIAPAHHRSASASGISGVRRAQNLAAKAANARLARVMASQAAAEAEDDEDDDGGGLLPSAAPAGAGIRFGLPRSTASSNGNGRGGASFFGRTARSPSPASTRNIVETAPPSRSSSAGRPSLSIRTAPMVPQTKTTIKTPTPIPATESSLDKHRDKRFSADVAHLSQREPEALRETSALQDQVDVLEEENYNLLEKLQLAEERCKEAEARSKALEKQVANLGEGVSLEARLLSRKEAALRQREEAVKAAMKKKDDKGEEIAALQQQLQSAKSEAATTAEQLREAELEANALRSMTQRMILTQEEMEEVVLKRCWLARHWYLAVQHGIYPEIASTKYEHWSSLAPLPLEVVISAGQRAKNESWGNGYHDSERRDKLVPDLTDITGEGNIESMLAVEKGLRELVSLKVEDAVVLALAQHRRPNLLRQSSTDIKSPGDPKFIEAFELSQEETEDVRFKQAWLTYFWRRAKAHGVEEDIAEDRLQFWIGLMGQSPSSHDVVDVERGLVELRKLGIEQQLWEASRRDTSSKPKLSIEEDS